MYTFRALPRVVRSTSIRFLLLLSLFLIASPAKAQPPGGVDREAMWYAPTTEDWKKPVLITFQRTWEDALTVAREEQKAILVCVNMDGEIASEHYAGVRYRQPDIAQLYEPYVCVIASVYRHTPRDYDEAGERLLCPRFGSVTCGEHISIEPLVYEKFLDGRRIAPRHIMVELDGSEVYDVFYAWDTDSVFQAIQDGIANREIDPRTIVRGDRPILERVASRHIEDRKAVEEAFKEGDKELRAKLLAAAQEHPEAAPLDLLRLAIFGLDSELSERARNALAKVDSEDATGLIVEALRVPMGDQDRETLIGALERLGETSSRAKTLAVVQRGLSGGQSAVNVEGWTDRLAGAAYQPATDYVDLGSQLEQKSSMTKDQPKSAESQLELAEASLAYVVNPETAAGLAGDPKTAQSFQKLLYEDALEQAFEAESLGAEGWRVDAVVALASYYLGDKEAAYERAADAVKALPPGDASWNAMAVLGLFAESRRQAILDALGQKEEWPKEWLTDVHSTYSILAKHPLGTAGQVVAHYDFLRRLGATDKASRALQEGLARFPESPMLHDRLRGRILADRGVQGLEAVYARMLQGENVQPITRWYAGLATMVTAELQRRNGNSDEALAAYDRAMALYEQYIEEQPDNRDSADHYIALALAGQSRVKFQDRDADAALDLLIASLQRRPQSAATQDGMNLSPADTARTLRGYFRREEKVDQLQRLEAALSKLDPELLQLPAYEREVGPDGRPVRQGRRQPRPDRDGSSDEKGDGNGGRRDR
ncbi:MAG: hypothetical protein RL885_07305 [Planctomycetota bacterium]